MPYTEAEIDAFRRDLKGLHEEASKFFSEIVEAFKDVHLMRFDGPDVWSNLTPDAQATALRLRERLKPLVLGRMMEIARQSPLLSEHDRTDLEIAMRRMAAALQFKRYYHWDEVLHDSLGYTVDTMGHPESIAALHAYDLELSSGLWDAHSVQNSSV